MIVGITGTIGSGKSTVSQIIRQKGYIVLDADAIQHDLMKPGREVYETIIENFSRDILACDGSIDRVALRKIVFSDPSKKKLLEEISYKNILDELQLNSKNHDLIFWEVPLLFEAGWDAYVDYIVVVSADERTLIERVMKRNAMAEEEVLRIIQTQMPVEFKKKKANYVLENTGDMIELKHNVDILLDTILKWKGDYYGDIR